MSSIDEARRKIEERRAQQDQQRASATQDLWFRKNDLAIAHPIFTGQDGDPYFEVYMAHEYPAKGQGQWPTLKYCPVESGHDGNYDCQGCRENIKLKQRMIMWFWVYDILHETMKSGESLPQVVFNNKNYFRREVNGPKLWDTSAWRESPIDDIFMLAAQIGSLHNTRVNILCTGENLTRRFKLYMEPNSPPFPAELYEQAKQNIKPVIEILRERLVDVPTVQAADAPPWQQPAQTGSYTPPQPAIVTPYTPGGGSSDVPAYTPGAAAEAPKASKGKSPKSMF